MLVRQSIVALSVLVVTAVASADAAPKHVAWTRAALSRTPVSKHDKTPERLELRAQQQTKFATEIASVSERAPLPPKQWASLLIAIGAAESHYDTEIINGNCKPWACDRGRARGAFQGHRLRFVQDLWDAAHGDPRVQVEMADKVLRRTWGTCLKQGVAMPAAAFRGYAGVSCSWPMRGEELRLSYYARAMSTPSVKVEAGS
jgi:hypothetical protein